jgi:hypothetical protein
MRPMSEKNASLSRRSVAEVPKSFRQMTLSQTTRANFLISLMTRICVTSLKLMTKGEGAAGFLCSAFRRHLQRPGRREVRLRLQVRLPAESRE